MVPASIARRAGLLLVGAAALLGVGLGLGPVSALATHDGTTASDCPVAPAAAETMPATSTDTAKEVRSMRRELVGQCKALSYWLAHNAVIQRGVEVRVGPTGPVASRLDTVIDRQDDPIAVSNGEANPVWVRGRALEGPTGPAGPTGPSGAHGSNSDPAYVRLAEGEASDDHALAAVADLRADVWFGLGLLATMLFGYGLYRAVMPRA